MNKLVLISGVSVSKGGVGRLLRNLIPEAKSRGYKIITRHVVSIASLVREKQYLMLAMELMHRLLSLVAFKIKCRFIRGDIVLVLYPQTIGYKTFLRLVERNNVFLYVMDNNYFCMMSYNYDIKENTECLKCIKDPRKVASYCYSWPTRINKKAEIKYLEKLIKLSTSIYFLAQTELQKQLLCEHFGPDTKCSVVGMDSGEVAKSKLGNPSESGINKIKYDLVYHGSHHPAKGFLYFLNLSRLLPGMKIFIPYPKEVALKVLNDHAGLEHIEFSNCTWETGLRQAIENAKLVVNPSIWSAPIEGALLKSLAYNGNVAAINAKYSLQHELIEKGVVWELPKDTGKSADMITALLKENKNKSYEADSWLREFLKTNNVSNVFSVIDSV